METSQRTTIHWVKDKALNTRVGLGPGQLEKENPEELNQKEVQVHSTNHNRKKQFRTEGEMGDYVTPKKEGRLTKIRQENGMRLATRQIEKIGTIYTRGD